jgi:hypothetical protein
MWLFQLFGVRVGDDDGVMKNSIDLSMNDIHISEGTYVLIFNLTACTVRTTWRWASHNGDWD